MKLGEDKIDEKLWEYIEEYVIHELVNKDKIKLEDTVNWENEIKNKLEAYLEDNILDIWDNRWQNKCLKDFIAYYKLYINSLTTTYYRIYLEFHMERYNSKKLEENSKIILKDDTKKISEEKYEDRPKYSYLNVNEEEYKRQTEENLRRRQYDVTMGQDDEYSNSSQEYEDNSTEYSEYKENTKSNEYKENTEDKYIYTEIEHQLPNNVGDEIKQKFEEFVKQKFEEFVQQKLEAKDKIESEDTENREKEIIQKMEKYFINYYIKYCVKQLRVKLPYRISVTVGENIYKNNYKNYVEQLIKNNYKKYFNFKRKIAKNCKKKR